MSATQWNDKTRKFFTFMPINKSTDAATHLDFCKTATWKNSFPPHPSSPSGGSLLWSFSVKFSFTEWKTTGVQPMCKGVFEYAESCKFHQNRQNFSVKDSFKYFRIPYWMIFQFAIIE